jgi:ferredoxin-NADP reductase
MFDGSRVLQSDRARQMIRAHRVAGYLFIALFTSDVVHDSEDQRPARRVASAIMLRPDCSSDGAAAVYQVLVARYYRNTHRFGSVGSRFLCWRCPGDHDGGAFFADRNCSFVRSGNRYGRREIDLQASEALMQRRCSLPNLDRVVGAKRTAAGGPVDRMRGLPGSGISESDEKIILSYLLSEDSINSSSAQGELVIGKAMVDSHCNRCHALDRTYQTVQTASEWNTTVTRMVNYAKGAEGFYKPGEADRIVQCLSATQLPKPGDHAGPRMRRPRCCPDGGEGGLSSANLPTIGVLLTVCGVFGLMLLLQQTALRPPGPRLLHHRLHLSASAAAATGAHGRQTRDCISLSFEWRRMLQAKPGQFLTFDWLLNGERLRRSFSISSSPLQVKLIEITVKKNPKGCVSHFLNERAAVGLTVEARGPFGRFHFDETIHKRIVLLAGGSGITPMMSMLRYIDDLALDTEVTLFYSVRTREDIIFGSELETLEERLAKLQRVVVLTRPDDGWGGEKGRLSRELILKHLGDFSDRTFFLRSRKPFMERQGTVAGGRRSSGKDPGREVRWLQDRHRAGGP